MIDEKEKIQKLVKEIETLIEPLLDLLVECEENIEEAKESNQNHQKELMFLLFSIDELYPLLLFVDKFCILSKVLMSKSLKIAIELKDTLEKKPEIAEFLKKEDFYNGSLKEADRYDEEVRQLELIIQKYRQEKAGKNSC